MGAPRDWGTASVARVALPVAPLVPPAQACSWMGDHWPVFGASPEPSPTGKTSDRARTVFIVAASLTVAAVIGLLVLARIAGEEISWRFIWFVAVFSLVVMLGIFGFFSRAARQGRGIFVESPVAALGRKERWQVSRRILRGEAAPDLASAELQQLAASHYLAQRWQYGWLIFLALPQVINLATGKVVGRPLAACFVTTYAVLAGVLAKLRKNARTSMEANQARWRLS